MEVQIDYRKKALLMVNCELLMVNCYIAQRCLHFLIIKTLAQGCLHPPHGVGGFFNA